MSLINLIRRAWRALAEKHRQYRAKHRAHVLDRDIKVMQGQLANLAAASDYLERQLNELKASRRNYS